MGRFALVNLRRPCYTMSKRQSIALHREYIGLDRLYDENAQHVLAAAQCTWEVLFLDGEVEAALRALLAHEQDEVCRIAREALARIRRAQESGS